MLFWSVGLYITKFKSEERHYPTSFLISLLILLFCHEKFDVGRHFIIMFDAKLLPMMITGPQDMRVALASIEWIPLCLLVLCSFSDRRLKLKIPVIVVVFAPPIIRVIYLICHHKLDSDMFIPAILLATSFIFLIFPFTLNLGILKKFFSFLGSISYSIYLIHFPLIFVFLRLTPFSGSLLTAVVRLISYLIVVVAGSYFLERHYQRAVVEIFTTKKDGFLLVFFELGSRLLPSTASSA